MRSRMAGTVQTALVSRMTISASTTLPEDHPEWLKNKPDASELPAYHGDGLRFTHFFGVSGRARNRHPARSRATIAAPRPLAARLLQGAPATTAGRGAVASPTSWSTHPRRQGSLLILPAKRSPLLGRPQLSLPPARYPCVILAATFFALAGPSDAARSRPARNAQHHRESEEAHGAWPRRETSPARIYPAQTADPAAEDSIRPRWGHKGTGASRKEGVQRPWRFRSNVPTSRSTHEPRRGISCHLRYAAPGGLRSEMSTSRAAHLAGLLPTAGPVDGSAQGPGRSGTAVIARTWPQRLAAPVADVKPDHGGRHPPPTICADGPSRLQAVPRAGRLHRRQPLLRGDRAGTRQGAAAVLQNPIGLWENR